MIVIAIAKIASFHFENCKITEKKDSTGAFCTVFIVKTGSIVAFGVFEMPWLFKSEWNTPTTTKLGNNFIGDLFLNAFTLLNSPTLLRWMHVPPLFDFSVNTLARVTAAVANTDVVFLPVVTTAGVCQIHTVSSTAAVGQRFDMCPLWTLPVLDLPTCERGPLRWKEAMCSRWTDRESKKVVNSPVWLLLKHTSALLCLALTLCLVQLTVAPEF